MASEWANQGGDGEDNEFTIFGGWQWAQLDIQHAMGQHEHQKYQAYTKPYLDSSRQNLRSFNDFMAGNVDITKTPGYQTRYNMGMDALNKQLAAQGRSMGGSALKSAMAFGNTLTADEYDREYNRRMAAAYTAPPVMFGGHPNLPTLKEINAKYKDMFPKPPAPPPPRAPSPGGGEEEPKPDKPHWWQEPSQCDPASEYWHNGRCEPMG